MRYIRILKKNIFLLFFIAASFIVTTYAWFAYSGLKSATAEVDVKAWYIEFSKTGKAISNNMVISLDNVEPGMKTINEIVDIENKGDSDAVVSYKIESIRILDKVYSEVDNTKLIDELSHDYPFHINISMKSSAVKKKDKTTFVVSLSWPLDSGNDELDSKWGNDAYNFLISENEKLKLDPTYQVRPAIEIILNLSAEQYVYNETNLDLDYLFGTRVLYDIKSNKKCSTLSDTCISTTVIDLNNKVSDKTVTLFPNLNTNLKKDNFNNYDNVFEEYKSSWKSEIRKLKVEDLLKVISKDIINSNMISSYSPQIVGNLSNNDRINELINKTINLNGYYKYSSLNFPYLSTHECIYTSDSYNLDNAFAFSNMDDTYSKIYGESKLKECTIIPVIIAKK